MKTEGWENRLHDFAAASLGRDLVWGKFDCCLMAADWALLATGVDPVPELRRRYKTPRGAIGALRRFAGGGVKKTVNKCIGILGGDEVPVARAQRGDVLAFAADPSTGFEWGLGVCCGTSSLVFGTDETVIMVPTAAALKAWRL